MIVKQDLKVLLINVGFNTFSQREEAIHNISWKRLKLCLKRWISSGILMK